MFRINRSPTLCASIQEATVLRFDGMTELVRSEPPNKRLKLSARVD